MRYLVTGLPRSRTAWMAGYLTANGALCYHEALKHGSPPDNAGNSDSMGMFGPIPEKTVIIERPVDEVRRSLLRIGLRNDALLNACWKRLQEIDGLRIPFGELNNRLPDICRYLGIEFDQQRADLFIPLNIQTTNLCGDPSRLLSLLGTRYERILQAS